MAAKYDLVECDNLNIPSSSNIWSPSSSKLLFISLKNGLKVFNYENSNWVEKDFDSRFKDEYVCGLEVWEINNKEILITLSNDGYLFAYYDSQKIEITAHDSLFIKKFKYLKWDYFYGKANPLGLFAQDFDGEIILYGYIENDAEAPVQRLVLDELNKSEWKSSENVYYHADLYRSGKTNLIRHDSEGLHIFSVSIEGGNYSLNHEFSTKLCGSKLGWRRNHDLIWFSYLSRKTNNVLNLITWQSDGLKVYSFDSEKQKYNLMYADSTFSERLGWTRSHAQTISFVELDDDVDGISSILYNGPNGFTIKAFDQSKNSIGFYEIIEKPKMNLRYVSPLKVIKNPNFERKYIIVAKRADDSSIIYLKLNPRKMEENLDENKQDAYSEAEVDNSNSLSPDKRRVPKVGSIEKYLKTSPLIRHLFDCKTLFNCVQKSTGKLDFDVPLFKLAKFTDIEYEVKLEHSGSSEESSSTGFGWQLKNDYILVDYMNSTDPWAHKYYLFKNRILLNLVREKDKTNEYTIEGVDKVSLIYNPNEQSWKMTCPNGVEYNYGGCMDANKRGNSIAWMVGWRYWIDEGSDRKNQCLYPTRWYLTRLVDRKKSNKIEFNYQERTGLAGNQDYTEDMLLSRVNYNNDEIVELAHESKQETEYKRETGSVNSGDLIEQFLINKSYVSKITYNTPLQMQTLLFKYKIESNKRLLTSLTQLEDATDLAFFEFSYKHFHKSAQTLMDKVKLPNQIQLVFSYNEREIDKDKKYLDEFTDSFSASDKPNVFFGNNLLVISEITNFFLRLRVSKLSKKNFKECIIEDSIKQYKLFAIGNDECFGVHVTAVNDESYILLYNFGNLKSKVKQSNVNSICTGADFVAFIDSSKNMIITTWDLKNKEWVNDKVYKPQSVSLDGKYIVTTNGYCILVYDDNYLWIVFRNCDSWLSQLPIHLPNYFSSIKTFYDKFDLTDDLRRQLIDYSTQNSIQFWKNIISVSSIVETDGYIGNNTRLFVLNSDYSIVLDQSILHKQEQVAEITSGRPIENTVEYENNIKEKITYEFCYKIVAGKILINYKDRADQKFEFQHTVDNETRQLRRVYRFKDRNLEVFIEGHESETRKTESLESQKELREVFLIDLTRYTPQLAGNQFICGTKKWIFNGHEWIEKETYSKLKIQLPIGRRLMLTKENDEDTFKLLKVTGTSIGANKEIIFDFKTKLLTNIYNGYPYHITFKQDNSSEIRILYLNDDKIIKENVIAHGYLTTWNDARMLVVTDKEEAPFTITLYPCLVNVMKSNYNSVIVEDHLKFESQVYKKSKKSFYFCLNFGIKSLFILCY